MHGFAQSSTCFFCTINHVHPDVWSVFSGHRTCASAIQHATSAACWPQRTSSCSNHWCSCRMNRAAAVLFTHLFGQCNGRSKSTWDFGAASPAVWAARCVCCVAWMHPLASAYACTCTGHWWCPHANIRMAPATRAVDWATAVSYVCISGRLAGSYQSVLTVQAIQALLPRFDAVVIGNQELSASSEL